MPPQNIAPFDPKKAKLTIESGRRARWWTRKGAARSGFSYVDASGRKITAAEHIERIAGLVIPPAWRHVKIAPTKSSRIQAVGMDATGRVQYLYNATFVEKKQREKFAKIERFGAYLPKLRRITNRDLQQRGFPREKVLAIMMRLVNSLYIRIGTEHSARHFKTYGITTLGNKHLTVGRGGKLIFEFVGKSHIKHKKVLVDPKLAELLKELKELGGSRKLFHYEDDAGVRAVRPTDLNAYIKQATSDEFSSKDFRTWGGSLLAAVALAELGPAADESQTKKNIVRAVKWVAAELGNTPAVCRSSYIHPKVLTAYSKGITIDDFKPGRTRRIALAGDEYQTEEKALLRLLES